MATWKSPTGAEIIGTSETVLVTAFINDIEDDGTPDYMGESEVHWDTQITAAPDGKTILYLDRNGEEWTFDKLTREG